MQVLKMLRTLVKIFITVASQTETHGGVVRLHFHYHITPEAPLSALKSAIAENGMGVTSRP